MGTWSNHPFFLVLIFDILLLHFGNICCTLPTAHPERLAGDGDFVKFSNKNPDKNQNSHITSKGCLFIPRGCLFSSQIQYPINWRPIWESSTTQITSPSPNTPKKRYKDTPRKIVVLASLQPSPPSQKNVKKTDAFLPPSSKQSPGIRMIRDPVFRGGFFAGGKLNFCLPTSLGGQGNQRNWILSRINAHIAMLGMQHMGPK